MTTIGVAIFLLLFMISFFIIRRVYLNKLTDDANHKTPGRANCIFNYPSTECG